MNKCCSIRAAWLFGATVLCLAMSACTTLRTTKDDVEIRAGEDAAVRQRLRDIVIPELAFRPPATIADAVTFFNRACRDYDTKKKHAERLGIDVVLKLPAAVEPLSADGDNADPFCASTVDSGTRSPPTISCIVVHSINMEDALHLVCDVTGMKFRVRGRIVEIVSQDEPDGELITRLYPVPLAGVGQLIEPVDKVVLFDQRTRLDWKCYFAGFGVKWPIGSSIRYLPASRKLRVTNTLGNLKVFEDVTNDLLVPTWLIDVDVSILAFRAKDIDLCKRKGGVSKEALLELQERGKGKWVGTTHVVTKPGVESCAKSVQEIVYPNVDTACGCCCSNRVSPRACATTQFPGGLETREVGMTLRVMPEIDNIDRDRINAVVNAQWVSLARWDSFPVDVVANGTHKSLTVRQPVFAVTSFENLVFLYDGDTILLGGSSTTDGGWVNYGFLTVRRIRVQPKCLESGK